MRKLICLAAVVVLAGFVYADQGGHLHKDGPDLTTCERALRLLSKGDRTGFEVLFEQWPDQSEAGKNLTQELAETHTPAIRQQMKSLGGFYGFELLRAEEVGSFLRRYTYACKYDRGVARWSFTFYRPADQWIFHSYHFEDDVLRLFADLAHNLPLGGAEHAIAERPEGTSSR